MTTLADKLRQSIETLIMRDTGLRFGPARWMVLARIEDDRSDFGPEARIGDEHLDEFVASFDPERRRVPVICAQGRDIPAHWADPLPPVGEIVALDRDLINLWGRAQSIIDPILDIPRLDLCVSEGFNDRSIGFHLGSNETEGRAALFHLALLGGEHPGISNMPTLTAHGFGLDDDQLKRLRRRRSALDLDRATTAQLIGHAVGSMTREWAALGGLDNYRQLAAELQHRTTAHFAFREDDHDLIQEALPMSHEHLEALMEGLTRGLETLGTIAERLTPAAQGTETAEPATQDSGGAGAPPPAPHTPAPPPTRQTPPQTSHDPATLRARAAAIANRSIALGILPRQAALEQAGRLSEAGTEAVEAWGESIDQLAQAQNGQVFREVRVGAGPPVQVNLAAHQFRVFSKPGVGVDERRLAVLSRAVEEVQRLNPGTNRLDPKTLERAAQRYLSVGAAR